MRLDWTLVVWFSLTIHIAAVIISIDLYDVDDDKQYECPEEWQLFNRGNDRAWCMRIFGGKKTLDRAQKRCEAHGGVLSGFESEEEWNYLKENGPSVIKKRSPNKTGGIWLGAKRTKKCLRDQGTLCDDFDSFEWTDNNTIGTYAFTKFIPGDPNNYHSSEHCLEILTGDTQLGQLVDLDCVRKPSNNNYHARGYLCGQKAQEKKKPTTPVPVNDDYTCPEGWVLFERSDDNFWCIKIVDGSFTHSCAVNDCEKIDGLLTGFETEEEWIYLKKAGKAALRNLGVKTGGFWVGAERKKNCGSEEQCYYRKVFEWTDGQTKGTYGFTKFLNTSRQSNRKNNYAMLLIGSDERNGKLDAVDPQGKSGEFVPRGSVCGRKATRKGVTDPPVTTTTKPPNPVTAKPQGLTIRAVCDEGWQLFNREYNRFWCIKVFPGTQLHKEVTELCAKEQSVLTGIETQAEFDYISEHGKQILRKNNLPLGAIWLGGRRILGIDNTRDKNYRFVWTDNATMGVFGFTKFHIIEPNMLDEKCLQMSLFGPSPGADVFLNDIYCQKEVIWGYHKNKGYACGKAAAFFDSVCPRGWQLFKRDKDRLWCIRLFLKKVNERKAESICQQYNSVLSGIESQQEFVYVRDSANYLIKKEGAVWIGAKKREQECQYCGGMQKYFDWTDNNTRAPYAFTKFITNSSNNINSFGECMGMVVNRKDADAALKDANCDETIPDEGYVKRGFICGRPAGERRVIMPKCPPEWRLFTRGVSNYWCTKMVFSSVDRSEAEDTCRNMGATLSGVQNEHEWVMLRTEAYEGVNRLRNIKNGGVWLGALRRKECECTDCETKCKCNSSCNNSNTFEWSDGATNGNFLFSRFNKGEPDKKNGNENCLQMSLKDAQGMLNDAPCETNKSTKSEDIRPQAFICGMRPS